jgi:hypothetical protein
MADLVVTVPRELWVEWIAEGDAVGEPESGEEWAFFLGPQRPPCGPGDRLYIVAHDRLRGYAPITRVAFFPDPCPTHEFEVVVEFHCERCEWDRTMRDFSERPRLKDGSLAPGRWAVARRGGAVACTVGPKHSLEQRFDHARAYIRGFRGFLTRWWPRADELEFPGWATEDLWLNRAAGRAANSAKPKPKPKSARASIEAGVAVRRALRRGTTAGVEPRKGSSRSEVFAPAWVVIRMGKRQTRRSISMSGHLFARLQAHCSELGCSVAGYVGDMLSAQLDAEGVPEHVEALPSYPTKRVQRSDDGIGGIWSF